MSLSLGGLQSGGATAGQALTPASITVNAGTAALPSINFSGDTTTGIYRSAASTIGFAVGGAAAATLATGGGAVGFVLAGAGTSGSITINNSTGLILTWSTNTVVLDSNALTYKFGGVALGGFTSLGTLRTGAVTIPDSSGTPGSATQNSPRGRAAFANAATTVVITNSDVTTNSVVWVTFEQDPLQRHWVTYAAGSFTVNLTAGAVGTVIFRWGLIT